MNQRGLRLRPATAADAPLLRRWDDTPHILAADPHSDWQWETALTTRVPGRESFIAEVDGLPIGFLEILDPSQDPERYWGDAPEGIRAIDIWIGEPSYLGRGFGTEMMQQALEHCFADPCVTAIVVDPLADNTRAHRFYERLGFRVTERRTFGPDDCLVLRLERRDWPHW